MLTSVLSLVPQSTDARLTPAVDLTGTWEGQAEFYNKEGWCTWSGKITLTLVQVNDKENWENNLTGDYTTSIPTGIPLADGFTPADCVWDNDRAAAEVWGQIDSFSVWLSDRHGINYDGSATSDVLSLTMDSSVIGTVTFHRLTQVQEPKDETPPVITIPSSPISRATEDPSGIFVLYSVSATDAVDGIVDVTCKPPSGSTFVIGKTTVRCTAVDSSGNVAEEKTFVVTIIFADYNPPVITIPSSPISRATEDPSGIFVLYSISATDAVDGIVDVTCKPPSGSTFVIGKTTVRCTATDSSGNVAEEKTFVVTIIFADYTPPVVLVPEDYYNYTTDPDGRVVSYMARAIDDVDGHIAVTCKPPSGSTFPIDTTIVRCTATDSSGNVAEEQIFLIRIDAEGKLDFESEFKKCKDEPLGIRNNVCYEYLTVAYPDEPRAFYELSKLGDAIGTEEAAKAYMNYLRLQFSQCKDCAWEDIQSHYKLEGDKICDYFFDVVGDDRDFYFKCLQTTVLTVGTDDKHVVWNLLSKLLDRGLFDDAAIMYKQLRELWPDKSLDNFLEKFPDKSQKELAKLGCYGGDDFLGVAQFDRDCDGINDAEDQCPDIPGVRFGMDFYHLDGCPKPIDLDGDGVNNDVDKCEAIPGPAKYDGCPLQPTPEPEPTPPTTSTDGYICKDGKVVYSKSLCPESTTPTIQGAATGPDPDFDGIPDSADFCPDNWGLSKNNGCPLSMIDSDYDRINDAIDACPYEWGLSKNNGCPVKSEPTQTPTTQTPTTQTPTTQTPQGAATPTSESDKNIRETFSMPKNKETKLIPISGEIKNVKRGMPVEIKIIHPDGTVDSLGTFPTQSGEYTTLFDIGNKSISGIYTVEVKYDGVVQESFSIELISELVPDWIKNNAKWWAEGKIDDDSFVSGIQFLIKEDILKISGQPQTSGASEKIPDWVKNNAGWWADGMIGEDDFVNGIKYLVEQGIVRIS